MAQSSGDVTQKESGDVYPDVYKHTFMIHGVACLMCQHDFLRINIIKYTAMLKYITFFYLCGTFLKIALQIVKV